MYDDIGILDLPEDEDLEIPTIDRSDPRSEYFDPEAIAEDFAPRPYTCMFWPGW